MFDFHGKTVLVAGGTGLIGIPLVELLLAEGALIKVVSRDSAKRAHPRAQFQKLDLLDYNNCVHACEGVDFVFNLLCVKGSPVAVSSHPATLFEQNLLLDMLLLRAACHTGTKGYLFASSVGAYPPGKETFVEDDAGRELPLADCGGAAKVAAEYHANCYRRQYDMTISIVRPASTYGPWDDFWSEGATTVPSLIQQAVAKVNPLRIYRNPWQVRDFVYAQDVARGMLLVAKLGVEHPVNLGSGQGYSIKEMVEIILYTVGYAPEIIWDSISKSSGDEKRVLDIQKARSLGFEPRMTFEEGIRSTIAWYQEHQHDTKTRFDAFSPHA